MHAQPLASSSWRAELHLAYERRDERTVLASRRHDGPLIVQKPLYPEGDAVCHGIIIHPPAGIVGGDVLELGVHAAERSRVLLTTPGASKWYRSAGSWATQRVQLTARAGSCLEWLPQEAILHSGALAEMHTEVTLAGDAVYLGWEILCLGRTGSGERYASGACRLRTRITRDGRPLLVEQGELAAGSRVSTSAVGLAGCSVAGTLIAAAPGVGPELVAACRADCAAAEVAVTHTPGVLIARYLGDSSEAARRYFEGLWRRLRPALGGREAVMPRIWRT
jgi:urease accessory protein